MQQERPHANPLDELRTALRERHQQQSWSSMGRQCGMNGGTIRVFVENPHRRPTNKNLQRLLALVAGPILEVQASPNPRLAAVSRTDLPRSEGERTRRQNAVRRQIRDYLTRDRASVAGLAREIAKTAPGFTDTPVRSLLNGNRCQWKYVLQLERFFARPLEVEVGTNKPSAPEEPPPHPEVVEVASPVQASENGVHPVIRQEDPVWVGVLAVSSILETLPDNAAREFVLKLSLERVRFAQFQEAAAK